MNRRAAPLRACPAGTSVRDCAGFALLGASSSSSLSSSTYAVGASEGKVAIKFRIRYKNKSPHERQSRLHVFASGASKVSEIHGEGEWADVTAEFDGRITQSGRRITVPFSAAICSNVYVGCANDDGEVCFEAGGSSLVPLQDMISGRTVRSDTILPFANLAKGHVEVVLSKDLAGRIDFEAPGRFDCCVSKKQHTGDAECTFGRLDLYRGRLLKPFFGKGVDDKGNLVYVSAADRNRGVRWQPSTESMRMVHAPTWNASIGNVPALMYFGSKFNNTAADAESYYTHLAGIVLSRFGLSEADVLGIVRRQMADKTSTRAMPEFMTVLQMTGELVCCYSTSTKYVSDYYHDNTSPDRHPFESFDRLAQRRSGDCDDLADAIQRMVRELKRNKWRSPLLTAFSSVLDLFVEGVNLCVVSSAAFSPAYEVKGSPGKCAHMFCLAPSRAWFLDKLHRSGFEGVKRPDLMKKVLQPTHPWESSLEMLVLEGTGRVECLMRPKPMVLANTTAFGGSVAADSTASHFSTLSTPVERNVEKARSVVSREVTASQIAYRDVCTAESFPGHLKYLTPQTHLKQVDKLSSFYSTNVHFYTDHFMHATDGECGSWSFSFCYTNPSKSTKPTEGGSIKPTYGVRFEDLIYNEDPQVAVLAHEHMSVDEIGACDYLMRFMEPVLPVPVPTRTTVSPERAKILDSMCNQVSAISRRSTVNHAKDPRRVRTSVEVFAEEGRIDARFASDMVRTVTGMRACTVEGMSYESEIVSAENRFVRLRIDVFADTTSV